MPTNRTLGCRDHPDNPQYSTYMIWLGMRRRCNNPNEPIYKYYGGRGITIDPSWNDFETFLNDMGYRPEGLELDRIDNDKGYSASNCRWVSRTENIKNRNNSIWFTIDGETKILSEWIREYGYNPSTAYKRYKRTGDFRPNK